MAKRKKVKRTPKKNSSRVPQSRVRKSRRDWDNAGLLAGEVTGDSDAAMRTINEVLRRMKSA